LSNAPDFSFADVEASIPQNNNNLPAEKAWPANQASFRHESCLQHSRLRRFGFARALRHNWILSSVYQIQTGFR